MANVVVGVYDNINDAQSAIQGLLANGFSSKDINVLSQRKGDDKVALPTKESETMHGSGVGAILGAAAGVLIGVGLLAIPGIGPVLAAGPLFAAYTAATAGAVGGGLIGAFAGWGVRNSDAELYTEALRRGSTVLIVSANDDNTKTATDTINSYHPVNIQDRAAEWKNAGWVPPTVAEGASRGINPTLDANAQNTTESPLRAGKLPGMLSFEAHDKDFRDHYAKTYANSGHDYDYYLPAYRYGYNLANDERFADKDWSEVKDSLELYWSQFETGDWRESEDAIRYARDAAQAKV